MIVAKIDGQCAPEARLRQKATHGRALAGIQTRDNVRVAQIFEKTQRTLKRTRESAKLAADAAPHARGHAPKMHAEAGALVFNPHARIRREAARELLAGAVQRVLGRPGETVAAGALPSVKTEITDGADAHVAEQIGAAAAADDHQRDARMPREATENTPGAAGETRLLRPRSEGHERAVKIEEQQHPPALANAARHLIPVRKEARGLGRRKAHGTSTRSGTSMRISVRSERR